MYSFTILIPESKSIPEITLSFQRILELTGDGWTLDCKNLKTIEEPTSANQEAFNIINRLLKICNSDLEPKQKYDEIWNSTSTDFSNLSGWVHYSSYYDPDTGYQEDVYAFKDHLLSLLPIATKLVELER